MEMAALLSTPLRKLFSLLNDHLPDFSLKLAIIIKYFISILLFRHIAANMAAFFSNNESIPEQNMKNTIGSNTTWFLIFTLILPVTLFLSCCEPTECSNESSTATEKAVSRPPQMVDSLKQGTIENKIVMVELYDETCPYCIKMDRVLKNRKVKNALKDMLHVRIFPKDEEVIEEFGLTQSPSYLFFKPGGELMDFYLNGYRSSKVFAAEIENFKLRSQGKDEKPLPNGRHPDFEKG